MGEEARGLARRPRTEKKRERGKEKIREVGERAVSPFLSGLQCGVSKPVVSQGSLSSCFL